MFRVSHWLRASDGDPIDGKEHVVRHDTGPLGRRPGKGDNCDALSVEAMAWDNQGRIPYRQ